MITAPHLNAKNENDPIFPMTRKERIECALDEAGRQIAYWQNRYSMLSIERDKVLTETSQEQTASTID